MFRIILFVVILVTVMAGNVLMIKAENWSWSYFVYSMIVFLLVTPYLLFI